MDRRTMHKQWMGVLVGVLACLAVARAQTIYTQGADLYVGDDLDVEDAITADSVDVYSVDAHLIDGSYLGYSESPDAYLGDVYAYDLDVSGYIGGYNPAFGIFTYLIVGYTASCQGDLGVYDDFWVGGKMTSSGGYDPPYVLYDKQTRDGIVEKVKKEVPPEKQAGAVLFFNADNRQLETYVPAEGKFYNLSGTVVHALPGVVAPATQFKPAYYLDRDSGQVKSFPRAASNKYRLKSGCRLDEATGQFTDQHTGEVVAREQAVELYNPSDRTYYDLQGQVLRKEQSPAQVEYVTEYYLDRHTGEVKSERRPVRQLYVVKKGLRFDKKTGQFTDQATGNTVAAQDAVVQTRQ